MSKVFCHNPQKLSELAQWGGQPIEILSVIADPDDNRLIDAECMPQYEAKLIATGEIQTLYIDETVDDEGKEYCSPEMAAVIAGQKAFVFKTPNPYTGNLEIYFNHGIKLGEIKELDATCFQENSGAQLG